MRTVSKHSFLALFALIRGDFPSLNRESGGKTSVFEARNTLEKVKMHIVIRAWGAFQRE